MKIPYRVRNLIGNRYGRLLVSEYAGISENKGGHAMWECVCDCNNTHVVSAHNLKQGSVKSCGCLWREGVGGYTPSNIVIDNDIATIELCDKKGNVIAHTIIDAEDYEKVKDYRWSLCGADNQYVAARMTTGSNTRTYLHRFLLTPTKPQVDHINTDKLNNRRSNLRECSHNENFHNQEKRQTYAGRPTTSRYKGVYFDKRRGVYIAQINVFGQKIPLGSFDNEEDAGIAYDRMALKHFGEFARINKIEGGE